MSTTSSVSQWIDQLKAREESAVQKLWQLLFVITERKAIKVVRYECRQKRGGGKVQGEPEAGFDQLHGCEPTPEFVAQAAEQFQRLLDSPKDEELKSIAVWKMEGLTSAEIADQLLCMPRTVDRKLRLIRNIWSAEGRS